MDLMHFLQLSLYAIAGGLALLTIWAWCKHQLVARAKYLPPGHLSWPVGGLHLIWDPAKFRILFTGGPLFSKLRFLAFNVIAIREPEQIKQYLAGTGDTVEVAWPPAMKHILGERSLLFLTGAQHRAMRKAIGPCFTTQAIEGYLPQIQAIVERYCKSWSEQDEISLRKQMRMLTFEVIASVVAGFDFSPLELQYLSKQFDAVTAGLFAPIMVDLRIFSFGRAMAARRAIAKAIDQQLDKVSPGQASGSSGTPSILSQLLGMEPTDDLARLDRKSLHDAALMLLFAGHETTATSLTVSLVYLHTFPSCWEKLVQEQKEVVKRHGSAITGAALRDMPYMDAVVKEVWRMFPVVSFVPRQAKQDLPLPGGYKVPEGWSMWLGIKCSGDELWQNDTGDLDPKQYNPDRWLQLPENKVGMLHPKMLVFGGGPRFCAGANLAWAEFKVVLALLARGYTYAPSKPFVFQPFPKYRPIRGFDAVVQRA